MFELSFFKIISVLSNIYRNIGVGPQYQEFQHILLCICCVYDRISPEHIVVVVYRQVIWPQYKLWYCCCLMMT